MYKKIRNITNINFIGFHNKSASDQFTISLKK
jgi:hypothetical protein